VALYFQRKVACPRCIRENTVTGEKRYRLVTRGYCGMRIAAASVTVDGFAATNGA